MEINEKLVQEIVAKVVLNVAADTASDSQKRQLGVFETMTEALEAVNKAYKQFRNYSVAQREEMIKSIRKLTLNEAEVMAKLGVEETGMGRVADKIIKHELVANKTPGTD